MSIITLISDFGTKDHYLGIIKGLILKEDQNATIVDISHEVEPFDLFQTAFILKNCYPNFPEGTVHVIGVDTMEHKTERFLVASKDDQYFIGSDNGIFSLIFDKAPDTIYEIELTEDKKRSTFPIQDIFVKIACHIAKGGSPEDVGTATDQFVEKTVLLPVIKDNYIQGNIIYIDRYQNVFVNITKGLVEEVGKGRKLKIYYRRKESIDKISNGYNDVPEGEIVCLFGTTGYFELAINKDHASDLLGLKPGDSIQIEFL